MNATKALAAIRELVDAQRRLNRFVRWGDLDAILNQVTTTHEDNA
jgi:hypothetical protein